MNLLIYSAKNHSTKKTLAAGTAFSYRPSQRRALIAMWRTILQAKKKRLNTSEGPNILREEEKRMEGKK